MHGVSSDTLVRLASGLDGHWVKKQCGLVGVYFGGRMALDLLFSQVRTGVAATRQDCNYQLDTKFGNIRISLPAKPSPNLDDTGLIVHRPMGLPVAAGWDRAGSRIQNL